MQKKEFGAVGTVITAKDLSRRSAESGDCIGRIMLFLSGAALVLAVEVILSNLQ